ncbi:type VI secretion system lipoprotein TssJ [Ideonella azotifigens]|uniref:Type VI secretion system lipoprotein TssJ n=1 Tax=Ideonella azotifigens TaxID=513160 RepID=A0ABN1KI17_9BURK|nr:type VI secretion system lipoprotein TssJ [Ideonella azotifigens]MCD2339624.1 type VI secretion system lipoprotein TssJ [Ideonella azotifigens]
MKHIRSAVFPISRTIKGRARSSQEWAFSSRQQCALAVLSLALLQGGCGTTSTGGALDTALQTVGLQRPQLQVPDNLSIPPSAQNPKSSKVALRLHAAQVMNIDAAGNSLPVVTRIYKLRDKSAFMQVPDSAFQDIKSARTSELTSDVVEVKEVALTPGQRYEVTEAVPAEAGYIGVVALFRAPAAGRWRFVFDTRAAAATGLTLGVHGCALSVATGQALDVALELTRLAGVQCPAS